MTYYVCTTEVGLKHLRPEGPAGLRPEGPTDTKSLCGRVVGGPRVKDTRVFREADSIAHGCIDCLRIWAEARG